MPASVDPSLFTVLARVKKPADAVYVRDQILATIAAARERGGAGAAPRRREVVTTATPSRGRSTAPSASRTVSPRYASYRRSYETVNNFYRTLDALTPDDLQARPREVLHRRRPDRDDALEGAAAGRRSRSRPRLRR